MNVRSEERHFSTRGRLSNNSEQHGKLVTCWLIDSTMHSIGFMVWKLKIEQQIQLQSYPVLPTSHSQHLCENYNKHEYVSFVLKPLLLKLCLYLVQENPDIFSQRLNILLMQYINELSRTLVSERKRLSTFSDAVCFVLVERCIVIDIGIQLK